MAERNAVKPRECEGCNTTYNCTAREINTRFATCEGGNGRLVLPDCGLLPKAVLEVKLSDAKYNLSHNPSDGWDETEEAISGTRTIIE